MAVSKSQSEKENENGWHLVRSARDMPLVGEECLFETVGGFRFYGRRDFGDVVLNLGCTAWGRNKEYDRVFIRKWKLKRLTYASTTGDAGPEAAGSESAVFPPASRSISPKKADQ